MKQRGSVVDKPGL